MSNRKKGRRNQDPKIPRDHFVTGQTAGVVSSLTFTFDPLTGIPSILELDPTSLRTQISHARENGKDDKVLFSSPTDGFAALGETFLEQLRNQFDYLVAVDTNTEVNRIDGFKLSACFICCIIEPLAQLKDEVPYHHLAGYLILDSGDEGNAERLGWHLVATVHINTPYLRTKRVGVIVDSELADHVAINARTKPYYGSHLLPQNMSLIYASSDKTETFANEMMRMNDKNSSHFMTAVKEMGLSKLQLKGGIKMGTATCYCIRPTKRDELKNQPRL
ncbi:hypothetical protein [Pseudomonas viridiflava]|uniref:hypothetical protein n=1 Tax=Pseudomonas viridiflava TaxID=33069 RepID=UPI000F066666|nr:hypothetical protein [Pseudomonas viridiflava]